MCSHSNQAFRTGRSGESGPHRCPEMRGLINEYCWKTGAILLTCSLHEIGHSGIYLAGDWHLERLIITDASPGISLDQWAARLAKCSPLPSIRWHMCLRDFMAKAELFDGSSPQSAHAGGGTASRTAGWRRAKREDEVRRFIDAVATLRTTQPRLDSAFSEPVPIP
jgi:hypothetical protein